MPAINASFLVRFNPTLALWTLLLCSVSIKKTCSMDEVSYVITDIGKFYHYYSNYNKTNTCNHRTDFGG